MRKNSLIMTSILLIIMPFSSIAAPRYADYQALYRILSLNGKQELGEYRVSQRWQEDVQAYQQQAQIAFSWKVLLTQHHYQYQDQVTYRGDKNLSYQIQENNDQKRRLIEGNIAADSQALTLKITEGEKTTTHQIPTDSFDYTWFALRFPQPCDASKLGKKITARLLQPATGEISQVESQYQAFNPQGPQPHCVLVSKSSNKDLNRQAELSPDGYLLGERNPLYRLQLVAEQSTLPAQGQEQP